jgi:hypothetical protein
MSGIAERMVYAASKLTHLGFNPWQQPLCAVLRSGAALAVMLDADLLAYGLLGSSYQRRQ